MVLRETDGTVVISQIMKSQRLGFFDEQPQHSVALGQGTDHSDLVVLESDSDELTQGLARSDDSQRPIPSVDQLAGGGDDPLQDGVQVDVVGHRRESCKETFDPRGRADGLIVIIGSCR